MKILLVNDVPVAGGHGTENHVAMLADALTAQGHSVNIVTGQHRGRPFEVSATSRAIPDLAAPLIRKRQFRHLASMRGAIATMREFVADFAPDVIHVHNMLNPFTLKALHELGPVVKSIHDCRPFCAKPPSVNVASRLVGRSQTFCSRAFGFGCLPRCYLSSGPKDMLEGMGYFLHNLLALRLVRRCEAVVVYSAYLLELAMQAGCRRERINLVHLFTEPGKSKEQLFPRQRKIVFAGFLAMEKGILHLLDAIRTIPDEFETVIIGDGPLYGEVSARAAAMPGKKITLTGYLPQEKVIEQIRTCTLVVFPSIGSEGCGMVGLEALALGKPVVAFDTGGVTEWLINGVTGFLAPRGDRHQLAAGIASLLGNEELCRKMGEGGRELVATRFCKDLHLGRMLGVYAQAIRERETVPLARVGGGGGSVGMFGGPA